MLVNYRCKKFYSIDPRAAAFMVTEEIVEFWRENNGALPFAQKTSALMTKTQQTLD
jgi:hypothetical protein